MEIEYGIGTKRVSSTKQGLAGDSPEQQQEQIMRKVEQVSAIKGKKIVIKKWFQFIESASGDLDMQPINEVIEYCKNPKNKVKYLFLKSIDRFTRGGSIIYGLLKMQLVKYGVQVVAYTALLAILR